MKRAGSNLLTAFSILAATSSVLAETPATPLEALRKAPDAASAQKAYAEARSLDVQSSAPDLAMVRRMIELDSPELAEKQAQLLVDLATRDASVWAALAMANAKNGRRDEAFSQIRTAVSLSNSDPLVLRTVAEFSTWYETDGNKSKLSERAIKDIELTRAALAQKAEYQAAYRQAAIAANIPVPTDPVFQVQFSADIVAEDSTQAPALSYAFIHDYALPDPYVIINDEPRVYPAVTYVSPARGYTGSDLRGGYDGHCPPHPASTYAINAPGSSTSAAPTVSAATAVRINLPAPRANTNSVAAVRAATGAPAVPGRPATR